MRRRRRSRPILALLSGAAALGVLLAPDLPSADVPTESAVPARPAIPARPAPSQDPLAAEIERWATYLRDRTATDEIWTDVKQSAGPFLVRAGEALRDGRRLLALHRLAAARGDLAATAYMAGRPAEEGSDMARFEAEWTRMGRMMQDVLRAPSHAALDGVRPAAVRALGEAALAQARVFYEASLEYGRNTMPVNGLFYLGAARAQQEFAAFCRTLSEPASPRSPPVRPLQGELDRLEDDLLVLYRPPVSIDRHTEFIVASATLKEARDLDAAGLRHGALLRYLQAVQRLAVLRHPPAPAARTPPPGPPPSGTPAGQPSSTPAGGQAPPVPGAGALVGRLGDLSDRLSGNDVDHSIGRLFLEIAQADLAGATPDAGPVVAAAIADDVLPRYLAALEPARPAALRPAPAVTVTLVRWPYT